MIGGQGYCSLARGKGFSLSEKATPVLFARKSPGASYFPSARFCIGKRQIRFDHLYYGAEAVVLPKGTGRTVLLSLAQVIVREGLLAKVVARQRVLDLATTLDGNLRNARRRGSSAMTQRRDGRRLPSLWSTEDRNQDVIIIWLSSRIILSASLQNTSMSW